MYLCEKLGIDDPVQVVMARAGRTMKIFSPDCNNTQTENTPNKCGKLSLPAPVTPSENQSEEISQEKSTISLELSYTPENSNYSSNCMTPPSAKKVFKRRNLALYTTEECEQGSDKSSSPASSDSPRSSKLPYKSNEL